MNVTQLIERTRDVIADRQTVAGAPQQWDDAEVLRHIVAADEDLWNLAIQLDENFGLEYATLTELGWTASDVQGGIVVGKVEDWVGHIKYIEEGIEATRPGRPTMVANFTDFAERFSDEMRGWNTATEDRGWFLGRGGTIYFTKRSTAPDPDTTRVWYLRKPPALVRFRATSGAAKTLTVDIVNDLLEANGGLGTFDIRVNAYRNITVECVSYSGNASPFRRRSIVVTSAENAHPNWDLTITDSWGSYAGTAIWETLPIWPEEHHELIALIAAKRALGKGGDATGRLAAAYDARDRRRSFMRALENRQLQQARYVHVTDSV